MEPTDTNLRAWEEAHKRIRRSSARGSRTLPKPVRERLPDIGGRHVLHLACGAGRETAALMSLGALVTGVDSSEETIVAARKRLPDAALVTASPEALPVELRRGRFDVVYSSWGALAEVTDLHGWAGGIVAVLKRQGILFLYDEHPVAACLDQMLHWHESYFDTWPVGRLIHALGGAGLALELLEVGCYVGIATHDEWLVEQGQRLTNARGLGRDEFEFQMLLGVRPAMGDELVRGGHRLRIYTPFGRDWYAYSLRRLQENPRVAGYIAADTVGRLIPGHNGSSRA